MVIAIDGPAASGKSTVARAVASELGFTFLDSGAMYRCVGLLALEHPGRAPAELAADARIVLGERVLLDGRDVSERIREPDADPEVRSALVAKQAQLLAHGNWVAEGRDIGTVVAPAAELKVFLTATADERARRRARELDADLETVRAEQALRDERDRSREHSPLRPAADAVELETTGLGIAQVVARVVEMARAILRA
jgi:cytidylate kinase